MALIGHSTLRRLLQPGNLVSVGIIAAVAGMVAWANWRDIERSREPRTIARLAGAPGASKTTSADLQRRIKEMETRLGRRPDDTGAALSLADALLRLTRVTGNPGLALRAEAVLRQALADQPENYDVSRMLGSLYLSRHRFHDAVAIGEHNRVARPYDPVNYGVIGDGRLELGDYAQAFEAFDHMMTLRPSAASYARVAYARELQGDLDGALASMKLAADATSADDPEAVAWTHAQIGDLEFQRGRIFEAKQEYARASEAFPGHPFAVIGYARAITAEGDLPGALNLLMGVQEKAPTPDLAARIGDVLERLGRHAEAEQQYALAEAGWREDAPEPKNLARFLADRGRKVEEAVSIARQAAAERQDIFTEDALAWTCFKTGRFDEAAQASDRALRTGSRDRLLRYHAAAIKHARGDDDGARALVQQALDGNPQFDLIAAPAAARLREELVRAPQTATSR